MLAGAREGEKEKDDVSGPYLLTPKVSSRKSPPGRARTAILYPLASSSGSGFGGVCVCEWRSKKEKEEKSTV